MELIPSDGEIPQLPIKLERARQQISTCLDSVLNRRRRFFGSLIASSQLDEVCARLQSLARAVDELCNYVAYRPHLAERYKQSLQLKLQLHQQYHKGLIEEASTNEASIPTAIPLPPDTHFLYEDVDRVTEKLSEIDYNAFGLVSTFNQQLRSLRQYLAQHMIVFPSRFPVPDEIDFPLA